MAQKNIIQFFGGNSKRPRSDDLSENSSQACKKQKIETDKKSKRKFRDEWKKEYDWLVYDEEQCLMFCSWCKDANKKNPFGSSGSSNFQKSALDRHSNGSADHIQIQNAKILSERKQTVQNVIERQEDKQTTESNKSKAAQLKTLYYIAKNGLPLSAQNSLIELQRENGCPSLQDTKTIYVSHNTQEEMLDAINDTIAESIQNDIDSSDFVGIIIDETTDIGIHKKLNIYFKTFVANSSESVIHFIDCISIPNGKADTIVDEIENVCKRLGINLSKVISMASDGASVMMGKKGGVGVKLREKHNSRLVQIHCVAHRLALCASQACRDCQGFSDFHNTVKVIYRYFHNSAVRYNGLRELERVLCDQNGDTKTVTLKEPSSFRWLSLENAVKAIWDCYPALVLALENEASSGSPEAKALLKTVRNVSFPLKTAFLIDILNIVNKLCKFLQKDELDIDLVDIMVKTTVDTLEQMKNNNGEILEKCYKEIKEGRFSEVIRLAQP